MIYRQGDVLIRKVKRVPKIIKKLKRDKGRIILAYGEATGHAHAIHEKEAVLSEAENKRFLQVLKDGGVDLVHEEHNTITLPTGDYEIIQQREYDDWEGVRRVTD